MQKKFVIAGSAVAAVGALGGFWELVQAPEPAVGLLPYTDAAVIAEGAAL